MEDVRELMKKFRSHVHGFALVEAQFETIIAFKPSVAEHVNLEELFGILDNDHDGRIDGLELLGGLALCCNAPFEDKARFCFELFDFNLNSLLSKKELVMMMMSSVCGMNLLTGGGEELEPGLEVFEALAEDAIIRADINADGQVSYDEFLSWARSNRDLMAGLEGLSRISLQAKLEIQSDDSAPETESDVDSWFETEEEENMSSTDVSDSDLESTGMGDQALAIVPWLGQIAEPTNYKPRKRDSSGPETNLKLVWAFGYRATASVNNVRFLLAADSNEKRVVYPVAAVCVIYNPHTRSQSFYLGHAHEITAVAMHPNQQIVATADKKSNIHIWTLDRTGQSVSLMIMQGMVKAGIQLMAFSPGGDRLVTVGMDLDHTVCVHNTSTGDIISSAKGMSSPAIVFDLAYSDNGTEVVLVGKNQVKFFVGLQTNKRALDSRLGKVGSLGKRQSFYCATYMKGEALVGCASGEIYRFRDGQCIAMVQAHGVKEGVLSLAYNKSDGTLLSGGKDGLIKTWDHTLKEVGVAIDLSEDLDGDGNPDNGSLNCAIVSLQQLGKTILISTRGCDIFEAQLPSAAGQSHILSRIAWGHSHGELWGLAVHPTKDEFVTVGDDKTIRVWSLRSHEQINLRVMPTEARTVAYNQSGSVICIGMVDGSVALIDATSSKLRVYASWQHSTKPINDIKISPDNSYLAVGSADTNIYIYKSDDTKTFRRQAVCRGHSGAVTHIDFSANSQYIQSNANDYSLLYWDTSGSQIKHSFSMRDTKWATFTCVLGWPVQGIWGKNSDYTDINACQALVDVGDIVTGDDNARVNLFRYPAVNKGAVRQSYIGHASHVTSVRFNWNRRYLLSTGGLDRAILVWKHEVELCDSGDEAGGHSSASGGEDRIGIAFRNEIPEVAPRSVKQEAANLGWSMDEMKQFMKKEKRGKKSMDLAPSRGDQSSGGPLAQWKSCIAEPSNWTASTDSTDVDLTLAWVHGVRCQGCRNNVLYSAEGCVVYNAASLAVVYHKLSGKQQFLFGPHVDEVIGIAAHPTGQIFATGEAGRKPSIVVWNSKDMEVLMKIEGAHEAGVPLLAFNSKGNILASIGLDSDNSLCIHDWNKGALILKTPTENNKILSMCFIHNDTNSNIIEQSSLIASVDLTKGESMPAGETDILVTGGQNSLKFWWWHGQNILSQKAVWGEERGERKAGILCIASGSRDICVTGSSLGSLLVWRKFKVVCNVRQCIEGTDPTITEITPSDNAKDFHFNPKGGYPHKSSILAMWAVKGTIDPLSGPADLKDEVDFPYSRSARYITGDREGVICVWRLIEAPSGLRLILVKQCLIKQFHPVATAFQIRSLCERSGMILLTNSAGEIYEITEDQIPLVETISADYLHSLGALKNKDTSEMKKIEPISESKLDAKALDTTPTGNNVRLESRLHASRICAGHSAGELWGLCTHPFLAVFLTVGDDQLIKCWNLHTRSLLSYATLPDKARAIDIRPGKADEIAVALNSGIIVIIKLEAFLNPLQKEAYRNSVDPNASDHDVTSLVESSRPKQVMGPTQWVKVLKYSFEGSFLAAGCQDSDIYVYDVAQDYKFLYKMADHGDSVNHLDFGVLLKSNVRIGEPEVVMKDGVTVCTKQKYMSETYDAEKKEIVVTTSPSLAVFVSELVPPEMNKDLVNVTTTRPLTPADICVQSTSDSLELFHWAAFTGKRIEALKDIMDTWWSTFTCPYGWSVQGIWGADDDNSEVVSVARNHQHAIVPVLATGDRFGRLRLYNYPCVMLGAPDKCYKAHTSVISNVAFSHDDSYCITVGGSDKCVLVWKTDILEEMRERKALQALYSAASKIAPITSALLDETHEDIDALNEDSFKVEKFQPTIGDQFGAVLPWKGAVREPTDWKETVDVSRAPDASLELKFVHGYRGWDCRNNLGFADNVQDVCYHIAGVGIVLNTRDNKQIFNTEHDDDILCLAVHPEGHTVATGEIGKFPKIVVWDANTGVTVQVIKFHKRGVSTIAFSADGMMVISCGMDDDRTVAVHNALTGSLLGKGKAGRGVDIYCLAVSPDGYFASGGKNHIKFWEVPKATSPGGELSSKSGIYSLKSITARTVTSCAYLGQDAVTGMLDGIMLLWKERSNTKAVAGHNGAVTAMTALPGKGNGRGLDGGDAGYRVITGGKDGFIHMWDLQLNRIWSLDLNTTTPTSICPQISSVSAKGSQLLFGTKGGEIYEVGLLGSSCTTVRHVQGHYMEKAEVWGLAVHPSLNRYYTCGDDMTVRLWDAKHYCQMNAVTLGSKCRAIACHPDGSQVAVALFDGKLTILEDDLSRMSFSITVASAWMQTLTYSPDGNFLAVGSHDNTIYLLETKAYSCRAKCKGHHSYITSLDFSEDSSHLQSTSGDYELLFWNTNTGKQIASPTDMRDVKWTTQNCALGWPVQGIWSPGSDGTDINAVDRSPNGQLLATGDDNRCVKLFRYPSCKQNAQHKVYKGHSEHVMNVRFSKDGKSLFTVGGLDKAVMHYHVKY
ncbi:hypothetical protein EON65_12920 [archaeon]|nr:MAG: hypothetical protein EON65_12920 [archaeon]